MGRSRRKQLVCFELSKALNTGADRGAPLFESEILIANFWRIIQ